MSKDDEGKVMYSLIEPAFSRELAEVLTMGAQKYGPGNWKFTEDGVRRYYDALLRHLEAWRRGEDKDEESGLSHLAHAAANIMFLHYLDNETTKIMGAMFGAQDIPTEGKCDMGFTAASSECDECCCSDHEKRPDVRFWIFRAD